MLRIYPDSDDGIETYHKLLLFDYLRDDTDFLGLDALVACENEHIAEIEMDTEVDLHSTHEQDTESCYCARRVHKSGDA